MNLLTDQWIPVRPVDGAEPGKISLRSLLCSHEKWEMSLPRDDMELAALQLLTCIIQVTFLPKNAAELRGRIAKPLNDEEFDTAIRPFDGWFQLDHPKFPFMQVRGVKANEPTPMEKLMAGLTGTTNCCFVNENGLAVQLCEGCTAVALFNLGSCSPSFGGGFKPGLRGPSPLTTLIQGRHLRETTWLNVIDEEELVRVMPWFEKMRQQRPTWMDPIKAGESIQPQLIGLVRGLFWQPAHVELLPSPGLGTCSCCGSQEEEVYTSFNKAKFKYTVESIWPHPHSPIVATKKRGNVKERFASFGASAPPSWTQLARIVVQQQIDETNEEGYQPALVVRQARKLYGLQARRLHLIVGGYLNSQASVVGRRHEAFTLNHGWDQHTGVIKELVSLGVGYRRALTSALFLFCKGIKDNKTNKTNKTKFKGLGEKIGLTVIAGSQFYRRSEPIMEDTLASIEFADAGPALSRMRTALRAVTEELFNDSVRPYLNDTELMRTLAIARRTLWKHLHGLEPQQDKGGNDDGTTETP